MKKILSRIFSVVLIAATVASPAMAQMAKKAKASTPKQATATMKAQPGNKAAQKNAKRFFELQAKPVQKSAFRSAKSTVAAPVKAAARAAADVPTIYGSVIFSEVFDEENPAIGLYEMPKSAGATTLLFTGPQAQAGGVCVDGTYYSTSYISFWGMIFITTQAYDVESGELVGEWSPEDLGVIGTYALDPTSGTVYGITYNETGDGKQLVTLDFTDDGPVATTVAALDEMQWNTIAFDGNGQLYGISYSGEAVGDSFNITGSALNKINKQTGEVTVVGETGVAPQYLSSGTIDKKTNRMFWNVCPADEHSYMYEVNLETGAAELLYQIENGDEVMGMYIPAPAAEPTAPAECENVEFHFDGASLEGTCTLKTPTTLFDGETAGTGELFIMVMANGEIIAGGEPQPWGTEITIPVDLSLMGAGMYNFTVFAAGDGGEGPQTKIKNVWVGADTPEATSATLAYANGNMEVSWNAVEASVNGGYINLDNLTYTVKRADGSVAAEGLTTTTFTEAVAEPENITSYYYVVYAVCDGLESAPAQTNTVVLGSIVPPYTANFAEDGLQGYTLIDANEDGKVWTAYGEAVRIQWNSDMAMDDWMITPAMKLEAGKAYLVSFDVYGQSTTYVEKIEVKWGDSNTADAMTNTLLEPTDVSVKEENAIHVEKYITPDADGTYFIGFHGMSEADQYYLYVANLSIAGGVSAAAPGEATNLKVEGDPTGAFKATVSFNAPDKTMGGSALASLTKVEVSRGETVVKTFDAPEVGAALSFVDELTEGGDVTYTVVGYNENGAGVPATVSGFVGFDVPAGVASATISRTAVEGEVMVTWDAVTTDIHGLPLGEGDVTYTVCVYDQGWVPVAEGLTATSYTYQAVEAGQQDFVQVGVIPFTSIGQGDGAITDMIPVGTPYAGLEESFANGELHYIWGLSAIGNGTVAITDDELVPSQDGDNGTIAISSKQVDEGASFFSGLVSLEDIVNPGLSFYTYNVMNEAGNPDINEISVSVRTADQENWTEVYGPKTVEEIVGAGVDGWGKVTIDLSSYANQTIQFQITAITKYYVYTFFDNIKVASVLENDLKAASITAPATVNAGADYTVDVKVFNEGTKDAGNFSVELYADEELLDTKAVESLAPSASVVVSFDESMSVLATEPVSYYAKVVYAADENMENNQTESVTVTPKVSTLPTVTDLKASQVAEGVELTWSEPNLEGGVAEPVTEDFEDGDAFSAEYGEWTFADLDGSEVGGFQNMNVPNITPGTTKGSFWIWDQTDGVGNQTFNAHSGMKYLFALFRYDDGTTDDWAISPELCGDAQTISFYAKSYSKDYPEKIRVLYNTSASLEPSDFVEVQAAVTVPGDWTLYEVQLPAGAKHFAINSCATGSFMLMIDDVTYTPAGNTGSLELKGYNVYRDGVKINDALVEDTKFIDANVEADAQYTYVVTAVYTDKGESAGSNEAVITVVGIDSVLNGAVSVSVVAHDIVIRNAEGQAVSVASANGAVVFSGVADNVTKVNVASGVYVVKAGKTVRKVMVK